MRKKLKKRLKKDLIIPKGTVFTTAPIKTVRTEEGHFETTFGLSKNSVGSIVYSIDPSCPDEDELSEWFEDI